MRRLRSLGSHLHSSLCASATPTPSSGFRPRAVALDLDGTLRNTDDETSPATVAALKHYADTGGTIILATGRPRRHTTAVAEELEAAGVEVSLAVCTDGAMVVARGEGWAGGGEVVWHDMTPGSEIADVFAELRRQLPGVTFGGVRTPTPPSP